MAMKIIRFLGPERARYVPAARKRVARGGHLELPEPLAVRLTAQPAFEPAEREVPAPPDDDSHHDEPVDEVDEEDER